MNYKERLKQYLEEDTIYSEYKSGKCDMSDFDKFCIEHCKDIECLLNEVEEKENLQEQLDYLRGGEYLNQLRFERDMLQHVVDNSEVSKVDKEFIDMTHKNTELLAQQKEFIEWLEDMLISELDIFTVVRVCDVLSKYKEIIGV